VQYTLTKLLGTTSHANCYSTLSAVKWQLTSM